MMVCPAHNPTLTDGKCTTIITKSQVRRIELFGDGGLPEKLLFLTFATSIKVYWPMPAMRIALSQPATQPFAVHPERLLDAHRTAFSFRSVTNIAAAHSVGWW
jgi:hypothetical protein